MPIGLDELPLRQAARITAIDWDALPDDTAEQLRAMQVDPGTIVEPTHYAPFADDPIACRFGAEIFAIRRDDAAEVMVEPVAE